MLVLKKPDGDPECLQNVHNYALYHVQPIQEIS